MLCRSENIRICFSPFQARLAKPTSALREPVASVYPIGKRFNACGMWDIKSTGYDGSWMVLMDQLMNCWWTASEKKTENNKSFPRLSSVCNNVSFILDIGICGGFFLRILGWMSNDLFCYRRRSIQLSFSFASRYCPSIHTTWSIIITWFFFHRGTCPNLKAHTWLRRTFRAFERFQGKICKNHLFSQLYFPFVIFLCAPFSAFKVWYMLR